MHIYFGLGSNLGDRIENLREASSRLATLGRIERVSDVYETSAWGGVPQPDYLNACVNVEVSGEVEPLEVLRKVKEFEHNMGRVPSVRWGERKIDIDLLLIDDVVYHSEELDVPHVRIPERRFVLLPLREILPAEWRHPVSGKRIGEMMDELCDDGECVKFGKL